MKSTLLLIHSHPEANACLARNWPYFLRAGCDILGIGRVGGQCRWPAGTPCVDIGETIATHWKLEPGNLPRRYVDTFRHCLQSPDLNGYTDFFLTDYDTLILKALPAHPGGLVAAKMCGPSIGFKASCAVCHPWWMDRLTAAAFVKAGDEMIAAGELEQGTPDYWTGLMIDRYRLPWSDFPAFIRNTLDNPESVAQARQAILAGVWLVHGVKTEDQLNALKDLL